METLEAKKRVALVTGGMGGLGEAICLKLAGRAYTVVTTYSPTNTGAEQWLRGMRERAARIGGLFNVSSSTSAGTEIQLSIPSDVAFQLFNDGGKE